MFLIYYDSYVNTTKPTTSSLTFEMEPDNKASAKGDEENLEITEWHKFYLQQKHTHGIRLENRYHHISQTPQQLFLLLAKTSSNNPSSSTIHVHFPPPPRQKKTKTGEMIQPGHRSEWKKHWHQCHQSTTPRDRFAQPRRRRHRSNSGCNCPSPERLQGFKA